MRARGKIEDTCSLACWMEPLRGYGLGLKCLEGTLRAGWAGLRGSVATCAEDALQFAERWAWGNPWGLRTLTRGRHRECFVDRERLVLGRVLGGVGERSGGAGWLVSLVMLSLPPIN